ncbi:BTB/POZ domain containing protein [Quillaja saponaria]|uniref:BTB/POZ domain containing protein n=1 Tax=Quillaja saponaria TaxID=32244 RepID=A0AAD7L7T2_QUISA|nr:BTB/POZ domain containing protein [Quillaja saponaria]
MAAATITTTHLKIQNQSSKPRRRKCRETTISASASTTITDPSTPSPTHHRHHREFDAPTIVSPENSWCRPSSKPIPNSPSPPESRCANYIDSPVRSNSDIKSGSEHSSPSDSPSTFKLRFSPGRFSPVMDFTHSSPTTTGSTGNGHSVQESFPSSFSKFNSALTAGLLSPPPLPDKTRSSPTLFEMMASEPDIHHKNKIPSNSVAVLVQKPQIPVQDRQALMMQRISDILAARSPGNLFNDSDSGDIKLTLSSKDGISVSMNVHRHILVAHSRFFAVKLSDRGTKQQRSMMPYIVEIADCDDVEIYIETLRLMYCKDIRKKLMKEDVSRVLGILKVSAAIGFDAGVLSSEVLKRVSTEVTNGTEEGNDNEEVLMKLLHVVLEGKDEKARREMKGLVSKMLRENPSQNDLRKESLYSACDDCLELLRHYFFLAAASDMKDVGQVARQADNLHWILDILIDRQIAEDFLKTWASQSELSEAHSKVPAVHRFEVSRVTARLFVAIGKGQLLASKDARCLLLRTWLVPFYDDFGWMKRASKGLDRHLIEDGLSNTILTLPLAWQQEILLAWFNRFLNSGDDCPNIQRGFEVWWRRAFWKRNEEYDRTRQLRITTATIENS